MKGKMKVCVLTGKEKLEWVERDIPQPGRGELQIKLKHVACAVQTYIFTKKDVLQTGNLTDRWHWDMNPEELYQP